MLGASRMRMASLRPEPGSYLIFIRLTQTRKASHEGVAFLV